MVALLAERGYEGVTVRELSRMAGVSSGTLYDHFAGKEDCFFRTYELLMARIARRVAATYEGESDWRKRVQAVFSSLCRQIADEPQVGRICFVEVLAIGPSTLDRTRPAAEMFAGIVRDCFAVPGGVAVPPLLVKGIVAGLASVLRARLLAGRESELPQLGEELAEWALCFGSDSIARLASQGGLPASPSGTRSTGVQGAARQGRQLSGDDRALIVSAATRLAVSDGYRQLSIPRIRAAAGVSRRSFDAHFEDIDDCFLAALELRAKEALRDATRHGAKSRSWTDGVQRTIAALCAQIAGDPLHARAVFVEIFASGTDGVRRRTKLISDVAEFMRSTAPPDQRPGELEAWASVGAVWGILEYHVASGRTRRLPAMAAMLAILVLAPSIGANAAVDAVAGHQGGAEGQAAEAAA